MVVTKPSNGREEARCAMPSCSSPSRGAPTRTRSRSRGGGGGGGAGGNEPEHPPHAFPSPPIDVRAEMLEEQLAILRGLWQEPDGWSFAGRHYTVPGSLFRPPPGQQAAPHLSV